MTCDEAYELKKDELVKLSLINSFLALREAFEAGWGSRGIEENKKYLLKEV